MTKFVYLGHYDYIERILVTFYNKGEIMTTATGAFSRLEVDLREAVNKFAGQGGNIIEVLVTYELCGFFTSLWYEIGWFESYFNRYLAKKVGKKGFKLLLDLTNVTEVMAKAALEGATDTGSKGESSNGKD